MKSSAIALLAASLIAAPAAAQTTDHAHDFDFLVGKWRVHHWVLKDRLAGSHEWIEFDGTLENWAAMNGQGNVDDTYVGKPSGPYRALAPRGYDPKTQTWAIWWLDGRDPHTIGPPMIGNFKDGVGTFLGPDMLRGKPVLARFLWTKITPNSAHWEQAYSPDDGKTWETNWRMELTRVQ
jgi:hypothetical protein